MSYVVYLLKRRQLEFVPDKPTEALGNCFPYAIVQQLHRPEIMSTLPERMVILSEDCQVFRAAVTDFVRNLNSSSKYYEYAQDARRSYSAALESDWNKKWDEMGTSGHWFDDQFIQFSAWFLERDIFCYS